MSTPENYGALFWSVALVNGDVLMVNADRVDIQGGVLTLWSNSKLDHRGDQRIARPDGELLLFAWAPGLWRHVYAASCFTGEAVCVDNWHKAT